MSLTTKPQPAIPARAHRVAIAALVLGAALGPSGRAMAEQVTFVAKDGVTVHAEYESAGAGAHPIILLFHQAGANRHEYDPIVPVLTKLGFDTLAVDQRAGGSAFGFRNATAAGVGGAADYLDAYPDMEAALAWADARAAGAAAPKAIVWGSSYSASLVFRLAAEHPHDVAAVLAFSPGEYFGAPAYVHDFATHVRVPVFVTSASDPGEAAGARAILVAVKGGHATQFVPKRSTHGSATLRDDTNPRGADEIWGAVTAFLRGVVSG